MLAGTSALSWDSSAMLLFADRTGDLLNPFCIVLSLEFQDQTCSCSATAAGIYWPTEGFTSDGQSVRRLVCAGSDTGQLMLPTNSQIPIA